MARMYEGIIVLPSASGGPWQARVYQYGCLGQEQYRVVETETLRAENIKPNAVDKLRRLVDADGDIVWRYSVMENKEQSMDDEYPEDEWADSEPERPDYTLAGAMAYAPPGARMAACEVFVCEDCGSAVIQKEEHDKFCAAMVPKRAHAHEEAFGMIQRQLDALFKLLGNRPQGTGFMNVTDRLEWMAARIEHFVDDALRPHVEKLGHDLVMMHERQVHFDEALTEHAAALRAWSGPQNGPGADEMAARSERAQKLLDDDKAGLEGLWSWASKQLGKELRRWLD
jgi:hypothetical protein